MAATGVIVAAAFAASPPETSPPTVAPSTGCAKQGYCNPPAPVEGVDYGDCKSGNCIPPGHICVLRRDPYWAPLQPHQWDDGPDPTCSVQCPVDNTETNAAMKRLSGFPFTGLDVERYRCTDGPAPGTADPRITNYADCNALKSEDWCTPQCGAGWVPRNSTKGGGSFEMRCRPYIDPVTKESRLQYNATEVYCAPQQAESSKGCQGEWCALANGTNTSMQCYSTKWRMCVGGYDAHSCTAASGLKWCAAPGCQPSGVCADGSDMHRGTDCWLPGAAQCVHTGGASGCEAQGGEFCCTPATRCAPPGAAAGFTWTDCSCPTPGQLCSGERSAYWSNKGNQGQQWEWDEGTASPDTRITLQCPRNSTALLAPLVYNGSGNVFPGLGLIPYNCTGGPLVLEERGNTYVLTRQPPADYKWRDFRHCNNQTSGSVCYLDCSPEMQARNQTVLRGASFTMQCKAYEIMDNDTKAVVWGYKMPDVSCNYVAPAEAGYCEGNICVESGFELGRCLDRGFMTCRVIDEAECGRLNVSGQLEWCTELEPPTAEPVPPPGDINVPMEDDAGTSPVVSLLVTVGGCACCAVCAMGFALVCNLQQEGGAPHTGQPPKGDPAADSPYSAMDDDIDRVESRLLTFSGRAESALLSTPQLPLQQQTTPRQPAPRQAAVQPSPAARSTSMPTTPQEQPAQPRQASPRQPKRASPRQPAQRHRAATTHHAASDTFEAEMEVIE